MARFSLSPVCFAQSAILCTRGSIWFSVARATVLSRSGNDCSRLHRFKSHPDVRRDVTGRLQYGQLIAIRVVRVGCATGLIHGHGQTIAVVIREGRNVACHGIFLSQPVSGRIISQAACAARGHRVGQQPIPAGGTQQIPLIDRQAVPYQCGRRRMNDFIGQLAGKIIRPVGHVRAVVPDARPITDMIKSIVEVRQRGIGTFEIDDLTHAIGRVVGHAGPGPVRLLTERLAARVVVNKCGRLAVGIGRFLSPFGWPLRLFAIAES